MKPVAKFPWTFLFGLVCWTLLSNAQGQVSGTGTVRGTVTDPTGAVIAKATMRLTSARTGYDRTISTDSEGRYRFTGVPLAEFTLHVETPGFAPADFTGTVQSSAAVIHNIQFKGATAVQQITVTDAVLGLGASATHVDFDDDDLEKRPLTNPNRDLPAVVESVPGVVAEENGRMHLRGAESQPQYVLDGVPISENLTSTFATALDTENVRSSQVITGNLPAEFGERTAGVINLTTKSGLEMPWNGSFSLSGGSFDSGAMDVEFGGHVKNVGVFVTADTSRTGRFLDPPEIENFHNHGGVAHLFTRFDWPPSSNDAFRLTLATNGSDFQAPNLFEQQMEGQNLRQELRDDYEAISWTHIFNNATSADVDLFRRSSTARLLDPLVTGTPFFLEQNRRQRSEGLRASLSRDWKANLLKVGIEVRRVPIGEQLTLAVTDPGDIHPESPVLDFTPSNPFRFFAKSTGILASAFIQDRVRLGEHLTVDLGLRLDHPDLVVHETELSPRIGVAYHIARTNTTLHASYNRLIQMPPLENILLSSSLQAAALAEDEADAGGEGREREVEKQNQYQFGFQQQLGSHVQLGVVHYVRNITNFMDDEQLFQTAVVFPVELARADIRGTEVRLDLNTRTGWTGYISYANSRATVTAPLVGGLFLESEGEFTDAGHQFPADSDERNELQLGTTYSHKSGLWGAFNLRYDSGIPTDFETEDFPSFDPRIQEQIDPVRRRIKPRTVLDSAVGMDLLRESSHPISLQLGVNNMFDKLYLYNFQSIFSGTHIGRPREAIVRATFHWKGKK